MTRKFYYIVKKAGGNHKTAVLFKEACDKREIQAIEIASDTTLLTTYPPFNPGDMLYRASTDTKSSTLFKIYASHFPVATVYSDISSAVGSGDNVWRNTILHSAAKLPIIKSVFDFPDDKSILDTYVEYLGGFPIIIKTTGESHGRGIMRIDSAQSLYSAAGILGKYKDKYLMRAYVEHDVCARLIVIGDKVVASIAYRTIKNDFRTNVGNDLIYYEQKFSAEIEQAAIDATKAIGAEFGGVDILIGDNQQFYIAEVNTPCNFPRCQEATGVDIAGLIIDHLATK